MPYGNNRNKAKSLLSEVSVNKLRNLFIAIDYRGTLAD